MDGSQYYSITRGKITEQSTKYNIISSIFDEEYNSAVEAETEAIAKASQGITKETLILALGGKMSEKSYIEFCANNGVEPDTTAIKAGSPTTQLRQTKVK